MCQVRVSKGWGAVAMAVVTVATTATVVGTAGSALHCTGLADSRSDNAGASEAIMQELALTVNQWPQQGQQGQG